MEQATRQAKERGIWSKLAAGYDKRVLGIYEDAYNRSLDKIRAIVSPEQHVLEMGCGTGIITCGIAPGVKHIAATDIAPEMIAIARDKAAREGLTNVEFRVADSYALPYEPHTFDAVLLFNTLHIVKEPAALLREATRLLKPGGYLVSATDCYGEPAPLATRLMLTGQKLLHRLGVIPFIRFYTTAELEQVVARAGFEIVETEVLHPAPVNYYLLGRKL
jgi:ubiquinone/menaquinone biosynthesis C-methylase UbiE